MRLGPRQCPAFVFFVGLGLLLAVALGGALALRLGLSVGLMAFLGALGVATEATLAGLRRRLTGQDRMVFLQSLLAIAAVTAVTLWLIGWPVLPYLEALLLAVGLLQATGRLGCFKAGCCHGRPHTWGVCYRQAHTAAGLDPYLVGVPLVPVQLAEAGWSLGSVALGCAAALHSAPGNGLAAYLTAYCVGRFGFEFLRGDAWRPYAAGFSEAQWTALLLATAVAAAGWLGALPAPAWQPVAWGGLLGTAALVALKRGTTARHRLVQPRHVAEVARALHVLHAGKNLPRPLGAPLHRVCTSLGVTLAGGTAGEASSRRLTLAAAPLMRFVDVPSSSSSYPSNRVKGIEESK